MFILHLCSVKFLEALDMARRRGFQWLPAVLLSSIAIAAVLGNFAAPLRAQTDAASAPRAVWTSFAFSYVVRIAPLTPHSHKLRVWIPVPSTDDFQTISELQLQAPVKAQMHKDDDSGSRYAYFDLDPSSITAPLAIRLAFHVVRLEQRPDLDSAKDDKDEVVLAKARQIFQFLVDRCEARPDECGDFPSSFVAQARGAGIPARLENGFFLPEGQKEGIVPSAHSWAAFYVRGIGWIPVDASASARKPEKQDYSFGAIDEHRVMVSIGRDAASPSWASQAGDLAYPRIEVDGEGCSDYSMDFFFNQAEFSSLAPSKKKIFASLHNTNLLSHASS
jgi:hypothetical protein